mmetsp:Transcript_41960/g.78470  ORF Transcript_41960/g.78470 Transcript_41960/m.78470 type:complete len:341 (-) Transcript_41960:92-1114(-)
MDNKSTNQKLRLLIDTQCRSITYDDDVTLQKDVESVTAEVKQCISPEVVDIILEMNGLMRRSTKLERLCDRKNPIVVIHNLTNRNWNQKLQDWQDAKTIYEEKLKPLLQENHEAVWKLCAQKVWAEQNWYDWNVAEGGRLTGHAWDYMDKSLKGLIWADYYTNNLGFSPASKISKNAAVKLAAYHKARLWTSETVQSTRFKPGYGPSARGAAFAIAEKRAKELLDENIIELILEMQVKLREFTHLNRRPAHYSTYSDRGEDAKAGAQKHKEELAKMPGIKKADDIYQMCLWCSWHEQNSVDYDRCTIDKLTGEANGYKRQAAEGKHKMDLFAYSMGFDEQ